MNPRELQNSGKGTTDEPKVPQGGLNSALYACALTGWMGVFNVRYIYIYIPIPIPIDSHNFSNPGTSIPNYSILSLG